MCGKTFEFASHKVLGYNAACTSVDHYHFVHLVAVEALYLAEFDLTVERRVCTEQKLLTSLSFGVECARHLCAAERAVGQQAAVFTCKRYTLGHTLVDDIVRHFSQTIHVGFTCAIVTAFHGVVEKTIH